MPTIRALLKTATVAASSALVLLFRGPIALARVPDPYVAPAATVSGDSPASSDPSAWQTVWPAAVSALVAIFLTLLVLHVVSAYRAGNPSRKSSLRAGSVQ